MRVTLVGHDGLPADVAAGYFLASDTDRSAGTKLLPTGSERGWLIRVCTGFGGVRSNPVHLVKPVHLVRLAVWFCTGCTGFAKCTGFRPTYSKSVLRAAAQEIVEDHDGVFYFPSYEIIMGAPAAARYFAPDMRNVTEEGVAHVMSVFLRHAADLELPSAGGSAPAAQQDATIAAAKEWVEVMCDEAMLDAPDD